MNHRAVYQQIQNNQIAGRIVREVIEAVVHAPWHNDKTPYIEPVLDKIFAKHDWKSSFDRPQIILYDELLTSEWLIIIHNWLRKKSANIENIVLATTHHTGLATWWDQWCNTMHQRSFKIFEFDFTQSPHRQLWYQQSLARLPNDSVVKDCKNITHVFSFYGGTRNLKPRQYLLLSLLELAPRSFIDYVGKFDNKLDLLSFAESATYFNDQGRIDQLSKIYDQYVVDHALQNTHNFEVSQPRVIPETLDFFGFQWEVDCRCFATVVRETWMDDVFATVTEKTLRGFLYHTTVFPVCYRAVDDLEQQGFWFPHELVDYSYQYEKVYSNRVAKLVQSLKQLPAVSKLENFYHDHFDQYKHNAELAYNRIQNPELTFRDHS